MTVNSKVLAVFLVALLVVATTSVVVTRESTDAKPAEPTLADRIQHACKPGYQMYDWSVYDANLLLVTCVSSQGGLVRDQYVIPVKT